MQVRPADDLAQLGPVLGHVGADDQVAVGGLERVRRLGGEANALALLGIWCGSRFGSFARLIQVDGQLTGLQAHRDVIHRDADDVAHPVALTVEQRGQHRLGQHVTAGGVDELERNDLRFAARCGHPGGHARLGRDHEVDARSAAVRAVAAVGRQPRVDEFGVAGTHFVGAQAHAFHHPGAKPFQHDVRGIDQPQYLLLGFRVGEVRDHRLLAAVVGEEQRGQRWASGQDGGDVPGRLADGRLDLDDLGAQVGQHLPGQRAGDVLGEIEYPETVKWLGGLAVWHQPAFGFPAPCATPPCSSSSGRTASSGSLDCSGSPLSANN